jgi:hypothetical protein
MAGGYGYDAFGNRWLSATPSGLPLPTQEVPRASSWYPSGSQTLNNRILNWGCDAAGT